MIDHLTLTVRDLGRAKAFYGQALAPLGYSQLMDFGEMVGFGEPHKPFFWIKQGDAPQAPMHLAFVANGRPAVDGFYRAALAAGARDNGAPGLRPDYHANYYGAFVFDLDGHPIEAVSHASTSTAAKNSGSKKSAGKTAGKAALKRASPKKAKKPAAKKPGKKVAQKAGKKKRK